MIYLTGDTKGNFARILDFCNAMGTTKDDIMIVLGGASINYNGGEYDHIKKQNVSKNVPITFFFVHGCHEIRPENLDCYEETMWHGGTVYVEREFPEFIFAKDGEVYDFNGHKTLVIGGGYSFNKDFCIRQGIGWYPDEQPDSSIKARVEEACQNNDWEFDVILSHSAPSSYVPNVPLPPMVSEESLDHSTEKWLQKLEDKLHYNFWFCGHYEMDLSMDPFYIMNELYEAFPA